MQANKLGSSRQADLLRQFPGLRELLDHDDAPNHYQYRAISIFDTWLWEEARCHELDEAFENYEASYAPLDRFTDLLVESTPAFGIDVGDRSRWSRWKSAARLRAPAILDRFLPYKPRAPVLYEFASIEDASEYARHAPGDADSTQFFALLLPELEAVYLENWDFTNVFFLQSLSCMPLIQKLANNAGVHILERSD